MIFGIADDDTAIGIEDIKGISEFVSQKIKERIDSFPEVTMQIHCTEDGKNLLTLEVMKGQETPYYYRGDGSVEAFVRIGNESVAANAAELKRLVLRGRNTSFGIVDEKGKLTNAGALLADNCPIRYSRLFCTHWNDRIKAAVR